MSKEIAAAYRMFRMGDLRCRYVTYDAPNGHTYKIDLEQRVQEDLSRPSPDITIIRTCVLRVRAHQDVTPQQASTKGRVSANAFALSPYNGNSMGNINLVGVHSKTTWVSGDGFLVGAVGGTKASLAILESAGQGRQRGLHRQNWQSVFRAQLFDANRRPMYATLGGSVAMDGSTPTFVNLSGQLNSGVSRTSNASRGTTEDEERLCTAIIKMMYEGLIFPGEELPLSDAMSYVEEAERGTRFERPQ